MRPEKVWRPIVTVEVDNHHFHETTLGADGQNINQKEVFSLYAGSLYAALLLSLTFIPVMTHAIHPRSNSKFGIGHKARKRNERSSLQVRRNASAKFSRDSRMNHLAVRILIRRPKKSIELVLNI